MVDITQKKVSEGNLITLRFGFGRQIIFGSIFVILLIISFKSFKPFHTLIDNIIFDILVVDIMFLLFGIFSLFFFKTTILVYSDGRLGLLSFANDFGHARKTTIYPDENPVIVLEGSSRYSIFIHTKYKNTKFVYPLLPESLSEVGKKFSFLLFSDSQVRKLSNLLNVPIANSNEI